MFQIISMQLVKMFLLILVGAVCRKTEIISHEGNKTLTNMLLYIVNPLVILNAFQIDRTPQLTRNLGISLVLAFLIHGIGILIARILIKKEGNENYQVERITAVYSNCGFMGIPLVVSLLGNEGVIYLTAFMIAFNVLIWTHGLILMTGNTSKEQLMKGLLSPVMFAMALGLFMFLTGIKIPSLLGDTVEYLTALNTPIGMLVAGVALAEADLLAALKKGRIYYVTLICLIIIPIVSVLVLMPLPISKTISYAILIGAACPAGTTCTMFALKFGRDYRYSSELFTFTTAVSLLTMPLIVAVAEHLL